MSQDTNIRFAWQQEIDKYTEEIVTLAESTIKNVQMQNLRGAAGNAQFSNFQGVTQETGSVAVIVNWVRYQMGRRESQRAWKEARLGQNVLESIEAMRAYANTIARTVHKPEPTPRQVLEIHLKLVRMYAGYLRRWFIAY